MAGWGKAFKLRLREFKRERLENLLRAAGIIFICLMVTGPGFLLRTGRDLEIRVLETYYWLRGPISPPSDVVIAALDDESYTELKASVRWPFPRKYSAEVMERITKSNPKILILDFAIPLEDQDPQANERLEQAIRAGQVTMVSGLHATGDANAVAKDLKGNTFVTPSDPRFEAAAKLLLEMWVTSVRGMVSQITLNDLPDATLRQRTPIGYALNTLAGFNVGTPAPRELIKFYGRKGAFRRVPFFEILRSDDEKLRQDFSGKVVLAGLHSIEQGRDKMKDEFDVPVGGTMFGVEIHATIAANLIQNGWLKRLSFEDELSVVFLGSLVFALIGVFLSFRSCLLLSSFTAVAVVCAGYLGFAKYNFWLPFGGPAVVLAICTIAANQTIRYLSAEKKVRQTKDFWDFETQDK